MSSKKGFNPKDAIDSARDIATYAVEMSADIVDNAVDILKGKRRRGRQQHRAGLDGHRRAHRREGQGNRDRPRRRGVGRLQPQRLIRPPHELRLCRAKFHHRGVAGDRHCRFGAQVGAFWIR